MAWIYMLTGCLCYSADAAAALPPALRAVDYADAEVQGLVASLAEMLRVPAAETTAYVFLCGRFRPTFSQSGLSCENGSATMALVERAVREKLAPAALEAFHASGGACF